MTLKLELGSFPPHSKQVEYISSYDGGTDERGARRVQINHYVGGRGSGKTHSLVLKAFYAATVLCPGLPGLITEPTYKDCHRIFMRTWKRLISQKVGSQVIWSFNKADMTITLFNGSMIDLLSRDYKNQNAEERGTEYAWAINDEMAKDKNKKQWQMIRATVRCPDAPYLFCDTTTTPKMGWYHQLATGTGKLIRASSYDNPYVSAAWIDGLKEEYSPELAQQELFAEWVSQSGRAWKHADLDKLYPHGNLHPHVWDRSMPYMLFADLGVRSGWLLVQKVTEADGKPVDVAVAEYTPNNEGAEQTLSRIEAAYGVPARVFIGRDVNTRSITDASTSMIVFRRRGWAMPITPIAGVVADKELQYMVASSRILNAKGDRHFCVSQGLQSHDSENGRGIREVLLQDTWPEGVPRVGEYLPKDKSGGGVGLEDMRDAWMYGMIGLYPPRAQKQTLAA